MKNSSERFKALVGVGVVLVFMLVSVSNVAAQTCISPPSDLVSWWPGDDNANDIQDGNGGTLVNGTTFAAGQVGQAFSFDGVNDYVDVGNDVSLDLTEEITADVWIKFMGSVNSQRILGTYAVNDWNLETSPTSKFCFNSFGFVENRFCGSTTLVVDRLYHLATTYNKVKGEVKVYVDGILDGSFSTTVTYISSPTNFRISDDAAGVSGLIDEVQIFNRALVDSEIQAIFNAGSAGKCKPFVLSCPASPIASIDDAISEINALGLDFGTAATLVQKLEEAKDNFTLRDLTDARSEISDFVSELEEAVDDNDLTRADANVLLNRASCILAAIQFP